MVKVAHGDTKQHVDHAKNDRDLHLVSILEYDLVVGQLPDRVQADWIGITQVVVRRRVEHDELVTEYLVSSDVGPPVRSKHVQGLGKDVVVYEAGVHREQAHQEDDVAAAKKYIPDLNKINWFLIFVQITNMIFFNFFVYRSL